MLFGKHINKYYLKYSPMLLLGILALVAVDYIQLTVPELYRMVINGLNDGAVEIDGVLMAFDMPFLLDRICLPLMKVVVAMVIGRFVWRICLFGVGVRTEADLRSRMFDRCKDLSEQYYQTNKVGNLMSLFTNDLETVQDCFSSGILMLCDALFLGSMAITKMLNMSIMLTVLSLIPMALLLVAGVFVGKAMMAKWEKRQEAFSSLSDFSQESFSGIAVIKAFVKETKELIAFRSLNVKNAETNVAYTKISVMLDVLVTLFVESVVCVILGYGGYLVHEGVFNAGELIEFIGYFTSVVWPVMAISMLIEMRSRGKASLNRVSDLLDAKIDVTDAENATGLYGCKGSIEFRNLTFRYPGGEFDVLKNVSLKINAGESIGIVGKTGSGKTTLVSLLLHTYNVPDGTVFIDGHDINTLTLHSVRESIAYVPQDNFLFSDTIKGNIAFANGNTESEAVSEAAKLSDVHDNISQFASGYDTVLGERGVTVSGGQKQRISIARALLKDAPILILDDSVSAVDTDTEKVILGNLNSSREGRTTLLIAHRITTVERMDRIIFIEDGAVTDMGTHNELYERCSAYRKTVDLQRLDEERQGSGNE